jgi:lysozyme family protein
MAPLGFPTALSFVLDHEGRVCENVPGDPGGATKWGITQADDIEYRQQHGLTPQSVFLETPENISNIYWLHYWRPMHCDELPYPLALCLFDSAVNCGNGRAVCWLQGVVGVLVDGGFGPNTMAGAKAYLIAHGPVALCEGILTRRDAYYMSIGGQGKTLHKFLAGWLSRTQDLRDAIRSAAAFQAGQGVK